MEFGSRVKMTKKINLEYGNICLKKENHRP